MKLSGNPNIAQQDLNYNPPPSPTQLKQTLCQFEPTRPHLHEGTRRRLRRCGAWVGRQGLRICWR